MFPNKRVAEAIKRAKVNDLEIVICLTNSESHSIFTSIVVVRHNAESTGVRQHVRRRRKEP